MSETGSVIGFIVILLLYASVGVFAVVGSATITLRLLPPQWEPVLYAGFLVAIAAFYLAFAAYFKADAAWPLERNAVLVFAALALLGARFPAALMIGYLLHGGWDLLHELQGHGAASVFPAGQSTAIPLAYGAFCATFDVGIAIYFYLRRADWVAARKPGIAVAQALG